MWLRIVRKIPVSAWVVSILYMFGMTLLPPDSQSERFQTLWFWTAIPLFWIWALAIWALQRRKTTRSK
jgi:membrane protein DedA with SNARE-associated domain